MRPLNPYLLSSSFSTDLVFNIDYHLIHNSCSLIFESPSIHSQLIHTNDINSWTCNGIISVSICLPVRYSIKCSSPKMDHLNSRFSEINRLLNIPALMFLIYFLISCQKIKIIMFWNLKFPKFMIRSNFVFHYLFFGQIKFSMISIIIGNQRKSEA